MEKAMEKVKSEHRVDVEINITEKEREIFDTLMKVVHDNDLKTTLRVAGGWVRDKIMGKESVDIDIALDDMFGEDFAKLLNTQLYPEGDKKKFGIIKANNEKSKHLETAAIRVHGVFIDLVNLRSETYTDDSRVPTIEIGSPEEDAYRRDLTINSLFYNINAGCVEDFTKMGANDLRLGLIRTPLEPLQTFLDDPLRVLRTVRFATRFDFKLSPDIAPAAMDPRVTEALEQKVSVERVGKEMDLMFEGRYPAKAVKYLFDFGIIQLLLKFPSNCPELQDKTLVSNLIFKALKLTQVTGELFEIIRGQRRLCNREYNIQIRRQHNINLNTCIYNIEEVESFKEFQRNTFLSALLLPFSPYEYKAKNKPEKVVLKVLKESIMKSNEVVKYVTESIKYVDQTVEFAQRISHMQELVDKACNNLPKFILISFNV